MSWNLYRWTWQLESPLYIGMPPAGTLNRCRMYVPTRALWGALTAELSRYQTANGTPDYKAMGQKIREHTRMTYLFPAEKVKQHWHAWLPEYQKKQGLTWRREDMQISLAMRNRDFRHRLLGTRPGTAIDPHSDSALDGSLRETECIQPYWRDTSEPVAMIGYLFLQESVGFFDNLIKINRLFLGGDTRYGLGRLRCIDIDKNITDIFRFQIHLDKENPLVESSHVLAHIKTGNNMAGDLENRGGWDTGNLWLSDEEGFLWVPGSKAKELTGWAITDNGIWKSQGL